MTNYIETDAQEVFTKFREFSTKEMKRALSNAVKAAGRQLVKQTKTSLKSSGIKNYNKVNPKYTDTLISGIRGTKVYQGKDGTISTKVLITSNRKPGSGSFRLKILEKGNYKTRPRYAYTRTTGHKLANRGNIRAYNFFKTARENFMPTYDRLFSEELSKSVNKINNKKFGK